MHYNLREIVGIWDLGYALDKHTLYSNYIGDNEHGHPMFDTKRTEVGEALYQLKYRHDSNQVQPLAEALAKVAKERFGNIGLVIPMPASTVRPRQPVFELAKAISHLLGVNSFEGILSKKKGAALKNLSCKDEKLEALEGSFTLKDMIKGDGPWNALLVDDLFDTGASMEAACTLLKTYPKIAKIFVLTLTWK